MTYYVYRTLDWWPSKEKYPNGRHLICTSIRDIGKDPIIFQTQDVDEAYREVETLDAILSVMAS